MNKLISLRTRDDGITTVNALELHAFLGVCKDFATWIKQRIETYGFHDEQDFVMERAGPQFGGVGNRGARTDYHLTLDMAKELAMVERTSRGRQARRYFIACERKAKAADSAALKNAAIGQTMQPVGAPLSGSLVDTVTDSRGVLAQAAKRMEKLEQTLNLTVHAALPDGPNRQPYAKLRDKGLADIRTIDELVTALGGVQEVAQRMRLTPVEVAQWINRDFIPTG
jgi:phage anti-repressor protein